MKHVNPYMVAPAVTLPPYSIYFDGEVTNERLTLADTPGLEFGAAGSAFIWTKHTSATANRAMFAKYSTAGTGRAWIIEKRATGNEMRVIISADGGGVNLKNYLSVITINDGLWHHIGFTFSASTLRLYVDGVEDAGVIKTVDAAVASIFNNTTPYFIARSSSGSSGINSLLCQATMWAVGLSGAEVAELYNGGAPIDATTHSQSANLTGYWMMNNGDDLAGAQLVYDYSGNNYDMGSLNMDATNIIADFPS